MKKPKVCECCGHPIGPDDEILGALNGLQRRMYEMVQRAGKVGLTCEVIRERLYSMNSSGGPESRNVIHVIAAQMNRKLEPFGIEVRGTPGQRGGAYKVQPINWKRRIVQAKLAAKRGKK